MKTYNIAWVTLFNNIVWLKSLNIWTDKIGMTSNLKEFVEKFV